MPEFKLTSGMNQNQGQRQTQIQSQTFSLQQFKLQAFLQTPIASLNVLMNDYIHDYPLLETSGTDAGDFNQDSVDDNRKDYDEYVGDSYADACERVPDENDSGDNPDGTSADNLQGSSYDGPESGVEPVDPDTILNNIAYTDSPYQDLKNQLLLEPASPHVRRAALRIIESLDNRGILTLDLGAIAAEAHCTDTEAQEALDLVQSLDPAGVAARSLQESLLLQLARRGITDHPAVTLLKNHYNLLEQNRLQEIRKAMGITESELQEIFETIRRNTTPTPLGSIASDPDLYVEPEVRLHEDENGEYIIEPLKDNLPDLYIREEYLQAMEDRASSKELHDYIVKNLEGLKEFKNMLETRGNTILQITRQLVSEQHDFIRDGDSALKPLSMADLADRLGVEQSTISRAVSGKFMDTPRGIIPYSAFFARGTKTDSGDSITTANIKKKLLELIDGENKAKPLSDAKLMELLAAQGISLSRRVIAKYREQIGIKNSTERKIDL